MACWGGREVSQEQRSVVGQAKQRAGDDRNVWPNSVHETETPGAGAGATYSQFHGVCFGEEE